MAHLIHSSKLLKFKDAYPNWNPASAPTTFTEGYHSVAITDDGYLVSHGKVFPLGLGVATGTYGSSTLIPVITVASDGKITITSTAIPTASTSQAGLVQLQTGYSTNSDTLAATASAVKSAYDDLTTKINLLLGAADALHYKGTVAGAALATGNAYGTLFPTVVKNGDTYTIDKGSTYKVSTAGYINGIKVEVGDMLICNTDTPTVATSSNYSTVAGEWDVIQTNLDPDTFIKINGSTETLGYTNGSYKNTLLSSTLTNNVNTYLPSSGGYLAYISSLAAVGSATQPVYVDATGKITVCTHKLELDILTTSKLTDTTYKFATMKVAVPSKSDLSFTLGAETSGSVTDFKFGGNIYYDETNKYITSYNTWRNIKATYIKTAATSSASAVLELASIASGTLSFGSSLLATITKSGDTITDVSIDLAWAEIDDNGIITYV